MEEKMDFLFVVECQLSYLLGATTTLGIIADDLVRELVAIKKRSEPNTADFALDCCDGIYVTLRDLQRIQEDLNAAVNLKHHGKREKI